MIRKVAAGALVAAAVFSIGWAGASWIVESTGDGAARSGAADALIVSPGVPDVALFPGGTGDVAVSVENPNAWPVTVTSFTVTGPIVSDDAACDAAGHHVTVADQTGEWLIPAGETVEIHLADAASMGLDAASECQAVTFTVPFALAG